MFCFLLSISIGRCKHKVSVIKKKKKNIYIYIYIYNNEQKSMKKINILNYYGFVLLYLKTTAKDISHPSGLAH